MSELNRRVKNIEEEEDEIGRRVNGCYDCQLTKTFYLASMLKTT